MLTQETIAAFDALQKLCVRDDVVLLAALKGQGAVRDESNDSDSDYPGITRSFYVARACVPQTDCDDTLRKLRNVAVATWRRTVDRREESARREQLAVYLRQQAAAEPKS